MYQKEIDDVKNLIHHLNKIEAKAEWVKRIHMDLDKIILDAEREIQIAKQNSYGFRKVYRGVWFEHLDNGNELPVGGSIFSEELSTKLKLDFDVFEDSLQNYKSPKIITEAYIKNKDSLVNWISKLPNHKIDLDPYILFVCQQVGGKIRELLNFDPDNPTDPSQRQKVYSKGTPTLSSLKGVTECGEQAALGQYLLQRVLEPPYTSAYMSCVTVQNPEDDPTDHSFIVLWGKTLPNLTYIFDIARPKSSHKLPRILETDFPFNPDLFAEKQNLVIGSTDVLDGKRMYFGVGHPMQPEPVEVLGHK